MASIQQDLETATASIKSNSEKLHDIVHGDESAEIQTDGGAVRSVAKVINDVENEILSNTAAFRGEKGDQGVQGVQGEKGDIADLTLAKYYLNSSSSRITNSWGIIIFDTEKTDDPNSEHQGEFINIDAEGIYAISFRLGLNTSAKSTIYANVFLRTTNYDGTPFDLAIWETDNYGLSINSTCLVHLDAGNKILIKARTDSSSDVGFDNRASGTFIVISRVGG